jgi:nucleoside-diphosphate-sugar epimerase
MRIAVTGATGFVGTALTMTARARGIEVLALSRSRPARQDVQWVGVGDLGTAHSWPVLPSGVDALLHLAAAVHLPGGTKPEEYYSRVNAEATRELACAASAAGIGRFVFLSTAKVFGEDSGTRPFRTEDPAHPADPYARSKWLAEQQLRTMDAPRRPAELVIVRPPLVYGPGVRANFAALLAAARRGRPLPVGALHAKRSLVYSENLVDILLLACSSNAAPGRTLLATDGEDLSVAELYRRLCNEFGHDPWLPPVPPALMEFAGRLTGRREMVQRLTRPLQLDVEETRGALGWTPPVPIARALSETCRSFGRGTP